LSRIAPAALVAAVLAAPGAAHAAPAVPASLAPPVLPRLHDALRGAADPVIGVGEQDPSLFADVRLRYLGIRDVRYVVAWDALRSGWQRAELDAYMARAEAAGARVLLSFNVSRVPSRRAILPSVAEYRRVFLQFRARYPFVRDYITWNEANHPSQPTARRPDRVAAYHDVIRRACPACTVVAADVLDSSSLTAYVKAVAKAARVRPRIWGLHNYIDANRHRTTGTRALLRAVRGQVWFTETGGIVWRRGGTPLPQSPSHAATATRWVFHLARLSTRVRRVYFYHWVYPRALDRWDSALIDKRGRPRPAYAVLRSHMRAAALRAETGR
jgi:hypothetical protein